MDTNEWFDYLTELEARYDNIYLRPGIDDAALRIEVNDPSLVRSFFESINRTLFTRQLDAMNEIDALQYARLYIDFTFGNQLDIEYALYWDRSAPDNKIQEFKRLVSDCWSFMAGRMSYDKQGTNKYELQADDRIVKSFIENELLRSTTFEDWTRLEFERQISDGTIERSVRLTEGFNGLRKGEGVVLCENGRERSLDGREQELLLEALSGDEILDSARQDPPVYNMIQHAQEINADEITFAKMEDRKTANFQTVAQTSDEPRWNQKIKMLDIDELMADTDPDDTEEIIENIQLLIGDGELKLFCEAPGYSYLSSAYLLTQDFSKYGPKEQRYPDDKNSSLSYGRICCKHLFRILEEITENVNKNLLEPMDDAIRPKIRRGLYDQ